MVIRVYKSFCENILKRLFLFLIAIIIAVPAVLFAGIVEKDLSGFFEEEGFEGCFILKNLQNGSQIIYNEPRTTEAFLPASTFKILNSLIALETGVVEDENTVFTWDGKKRLLDKWNRDLDFKTALKFSAVWVYQDIARRVGEERMQEWVTKVDYGNKDISGGIDLFWLQGGIRITPKQQIEFLEKLVKDELPFSKQNMAIVRSMMENEQSGEYVLYGKTGWAARVKPNIGWYVGFVTKGDDTYVFVSNFVHLGEEPPQWFSNVGKKMTIRILDHLGAWEESE